MVTGALSEPFTMDGSIVREGGVWAATTGARSTSSARSHAVRMV